MSYVDDYLQEAERIASARHARNDRAEAERLELLDIRTRLRAVSDATDEDGDWLWIVARMLSPYILRRCPHDPDEYEAEKFGSMYQEPEKTYAEVRCPHCDAEGRIYDQTLVSRLRRRVEAH